MSAIEIVASVFLVTGSALYLLAAVGLQRFDSVFARMHSATKAVTLGLLLVCVGAALLIDDTGDRVKLLLVAALQFMDRAGGVPRGGASGVPIRYRAPPRRGDRRVGRRARRWVGARRRRRVVTGSQPRPQSALSRWRGARRPVPAACSWRPCRGSRPGTRRRNRPPAGP